ncbi:MAG: sulfide-dependent adenosine diphosphate thiazole synthase [Archaeoglobi archaeon]|nr:sulfide-dependent adenosine diphosphate thiazole synthase [Archaeoglobi archaeon]
MSRTLSEGDLAELFFRASFEELRSITKNDVIIAGAGPSGLVAAWKLAERGKKVLVVERMLGVGGGIRGGGMLLPVALLQEEASSILREAGVTLKSLTEDLYYVNPVEMSVKLASKAIDSGARILVGVEVDDLIVRRGENFRVEGVVINWTPVIEARWHVDPLMLEARAVVDATGHDARVLRTLAARCPELKIDVKGMSGMDVWRGEEDVVKFTGKVVDGFYLAGMSVAELHNTTRMGPIFGGMLLSGKKVAELILQDLG